MQSSPDSICTGTSITLSWSKGEYLVMRGGYRGYGIDPPRYVSIYHIPSNNWSFFNDPEGTGKALSGSRLITDDDSTLTYPRVYTPNTYYEIDLNTAQLTTRQIVGLGDFSYVPGVQFGNILYLFNSALKRIAKLNLDTFSLTFTTLTEWPYFFQPSVNARLGNDFYLLGTGASASTREGYLFNHLTETFTAINFTNAINQNNCGYVQVGKNLYLFDSNFTKLDLTTLTFTDITLRNDAVHPHLNGKPLSSPLLFHYNNKIYTYGGSTSSPIAYQNKWFEYTPPEGIDLATW